MKKKNLLIIHGGGPTAVLNASLYGSIREAMKSEEIDNIYGSIGGVEGIIKNNLKNLAVDDDSLEKLLNTPGTAIGSSRYPLEDKDYELLADKLHSLDIDYVIMSGGNGTMDTCGKLSKKASKYGISVMGVPKTMDNDIEAIDHSPGYLSAAKYIACTVSEICQDVRSLPIHVCIVETMGRNAGWVVGASSLARDENGRGPDLIYLPEMPFDEDDFIEKIKKLHEKKKGIVVVVPEGLRDKKGESVVPPIFKVSRSTYFGDISSYLAELVIKRLGIKARGEKMGLAGRCSIALRSRRDVDEAVRVGELGVRALLDGYSGYMVGIKIDENNDTVYPLIPIDEVMLVEKKLPDYFINDDGVTSDFSKWLKELLAEDLCCFYDYID